MKAEALQGVIHSDTEIMGGTPVFVGTRVPLQNLIDYLEGGESVEDFLDAFPTVKREQVIAVIEAGKPEEFQRFEQFTKALMAVPKKEIDQQKAKYDKHKAAKKRRAA